MASRNGRILGGFGLLGVGLASIAYLGSVRWNEKTAYLVERLLRRQALDRKAEVDFREIEMLPDPVARYFRTTLRTEQPIIRWARIRQTGLFRARGERGTWSPFKATQYFFTRPPGFVWDGEMRMNGLASMRVRDAYIDGAGSIQAQLFALMSMVNAHGDREISAGALQRYLAEAVWLPTALLPGAGVQWRGIDNHSAVASLTDSGMTVSLEFRFNDAGEITSVFTPGRYRQINGRYELTPWHGEFSNYRETHGMRVPLDAVAAWKLHEESIPYFSGRVVDVTYDYAV